MGSLLSFLPMAAAAPAHAFAAERDARPGDFGFKAPNPRPALPSWFDAYKPPFIATTDSAPAIAEATKTAGPGETLVASGSGLDSIPRFTLFAQKASGKPIRRTVEPLARDDVGAALQIPGAVPGWSMYMVWPQSGRGYGAPVAVNRTEAWWVGPKPAILGGTSSVYGRNLAYANGTRQAGVYLKKPDGPGRWVPVVKTNPYRVEFRIPRNMAVGRYEVWAHNGHGGHFGWSGPLEIIVQRSPWMGQDARSFNVRDYGARGDGTSDDEAAIQRALDAAGRMAPSTVVFPAGTYMVSRGFQPPNNVRWKGAGSKTTTIRASDDFRTDSSDPRSFALLFAERAGHGNNIEIRGLTFDQGRNPGVLGFPIWFRWVSNVRLVASRVISRPGQFFNFEYAQQIHVLRSTFIGSGGWLGNGRQIFIQNSIFRLTDNANSGLHTQGNGAEVAIIGNTLKDYDSSTPEGTAAGRFFVSQGHQGSTEHYYFSGNRTVNLAPPAQDWRDFDPNAGEQILFEQCCSGSVEAVEQASGRTIRLQGVSGRFEFRGPQDVMINSGAGVGQTRRITAYDASTGTIQVDRPWRVAPARGDQATVTSTASKIAIYRNRFDGKGNYATRDTASCAVQLYSNSTDIVVDGNTATNMRGGFEMWSMGNTDSREMNAVYFNLFARNKTFSSYDAIAAYNMYIYWSVEGTVGHFGNVYRRNIGRDLTNAGVSIRTWHEQPGGEYRLNVFEHNRFVNTRNGLIAGSMSPPSRTVLVQTILNRDIYDRGTATLQGSRGFVAPRGSSWVDVDSAWKNFQHLNDGPQ